MTYAERWYWCEVVDAQDRPEEPDWSRVPADRRDTVRARWLERATPEPRRWKLWGPQIPMYERMPVMGVTVVGPG